jgi:hypothetical protein
MWPACVGLADKGCFAPLFWSEKKNQNKGAKQPLSASPTHVGHML